MKLLRPPASLLLLLSTMLLGSCSGGGGGGGAPAATLSAIEVTPAVPTLAAGTSAQLVATGIYDDASTQDLTESVTWSSSDMAVATVDDMAGSRGWTTSVAAGSALISATLDSVSGSTSLTVTSATLVSIEVTPPTPSIAAGTQQPFSATGVFDDGSKQDMTDSVTWDSSDPGVAAPSATKGMEGVAVSTAAGTTSISATFNAVVGSTDLVVTSATLVSLEVTPTNPSIALGTTQDFAATGIFSDGTNQDLTDLATWSSDAMGVATVANGFGSAGYAQSVATGSAMISADVGGIAGATGLTVTPATIVWIGVTPTMPAIPLGLEQTLTATGVFSDGTSQDLTDLVTWYSSDGTAILVSNATGSHGLATTVAAGSSTVQAVFDGVTGSTDADVAPPALLSIGVTPTTPSIALGTTVELVATGVYSDGSTADLTDAVLWSSATPSVASIGNAAGSAGLVLSMSTGSTTISALLAGVMGSTDLNVGPATLVSIDVTPSTLSLPLGLTQAFTATGTYTDATVQDLTDAVTWSSSDPAVATVSNAAGSEGLATSVATGSTTVTATLGMVSGATGLTITTAVLTSIDIDAVSTSVPLGLVEQLTAVGFYSDGTSQDLTQAVAWTSSDTGVAEVSNAAGSKGRLTSTGAGTTTITAALGATNGTLDFTVTAAVLTTIAVAPVLPSVPLGIPQSFTATGTYSDGTMEDVTAAATWTSSDTGVGQISNAAGSEGRLTSLAVGTTTVTAAVGMVSDGTDLTVTAATLTSIAIAPAAPSVALGTQFQFTATGTYTDASMIDITSSVTWSSSNPTVAAISNAAGSEGFTQTVATGSTTVTATLGGVSDSTTLDVTSLTLVSIDVTPVNASAPERTNVQYTATGWYDDGFTLTPQDITISATWKTSDNQVATVGAKGNAKTHKPGTCQISATLSGVTGMTGLTVTP